MYKGVGYMKIEKTLPAKGHRLVGRNKLGCLRLSRKASVASTRWRKKEGNCMFFVIAGSWLDYMQVMKRKRSQRSVLKF
jgi:hypothetical protein